MSNAAALQYFVIFAFIQEYNGHGIGWNEHAIIYVELKKARATFADIQQEVLKTHRSHYGNVKITGYHEITRDEYDAGLRLQKEEAKNRQPPPGDCVIL